MRNMPGMNKQDGAFLTIGELANELGVAQHILRYWEPRFPALRPLQRSGNRRYYRPDDVALARQIHHLLSVEGYTVRGAQQALSGGVKAEGADSDGGTTAPVTVQAAMPMNAPAQDELLRKLKAIRSTLSAALA